MGLIEYSIVFCLASIAVLAIALYRTHVRLRALLTYMSMRINLHDDQLSIARDLLVAHHRKLGYSSFREDDFIWEDTDDLPPMEFR